LKAIFLILKKFDDLDKSVQLALNSAGRDADERFEGPEKDSRHDQAQQPLDTLQEVKASFVDCFSTSTGHGLPQMVKPGNLFLNFLWTVFFFVALGGCSLFVYQAVDQYLQFGVITQTNIVRSSTMIMPAVTMWAQEGNTYDFIIDCKFGESPVCKKNNLTLTGISGDGLNRSYVQLNYGTNKSELQKTSRKGYDFGYRIVLYLPPSPNAYFGLAVTDNSARFVHADIAHEIFPGQNTHIILSKTIQSSLGPPYSNCSESQDYRQLNCFDDCIKKSTNFLLLESERESLCNLECPEECTEVIFSINRVDVETPTRSLDSLKSQISTKFNITGLSDEQLLKRATELFIYFNAFETTKITQSASMSPTNLVGNVGGLLGKRIYFVY